MVNFVFSLVMSNLAAMAMAAQPAAGTPLQPLGQALPPPLRAMLQLTPSQEEALVAIEQDLQKQLERILTPEQIKVLANARSRASARSGNSVSGPLPNIIVIVADDLGYGDIEPFGSRLNRTPHLASMAREGMKLTSFYACPVCTPSRAQMMTGCYAKRVSLPQVIFPGSATGIHADERTLPELLKKQGYVTSCIGKWHLGDQPCFLPTSRGFDRYFGIPYSNDMGPQHGASKGNPLPLMRGDRVIETLDGEGQNAVTARYTSEAVAYIRENKDRPFFLYLPHTAVHVPLHPGSAFRGKSKNGTYGDWVEELDDSVGQVLSAVRDAGIDARTMVLFTSDNGAPRMGSNAPLRGFKASTWEGGMRVPTIVRWPGTVPAGVACNAVCGNIDILPSCLAIAGGAVAADRAIDGKNLVDLWRGSSTASPHAAYGCFLGNSLQGIRSGQWKYYTTENWLFDLDTDIAEATDVAAAHPDVVATMRKYAEAIELDLGKGSVTGPGVRQAGRVASPVLPRLRP